MIYTGFQLSLLKVSPVLRNESFDDIFDTAAVFSMDFGLCCCCFTTAAAAAASANSKYQNFSMSDPTLKKYEKI
jgi:hypothetical protein